MATKPDNIKKQKPGTGKQDPPKTRKRTIRILWVSFILMLLTFFIMVYLIENGTFGYMPSLAELENPQSAISSDINAADGTLLGRYYTTDRSNSKFSEISPTLMNALIATEDSRFYEHAGIDPIATLRVVFRLGHAGGGSTISQQLAKNLFPRKSNSTLSLPIMKLKEWVLAVKLERNLTKNEIITMYLNTVPYGDNVYGIKNASLTFYNKMPDEVTVDEAATLVGMLKGNTYYNPRRNPKKSKERRNTVMKLMVDHNYLSEAQYDSLKDKETPLDYHKIDYHDGIAPYFRQVLEQQVKLILKDLKKPDGTPYDIYKDGLKITTTIDVRMQRYAEEAIQEHLSVWQKEFLAQPGYRDGSVWAKPGPIQNILNNSIKTCDHYKDFRNQEMSETKAMAQMKVPVKMRVFAWNKLHYKDTMMSPIDSIKYMKLFLQAGFMAMDPATGEVKAWVGGIDHNFFQFDHVNNNTKRQVGSTIKPILYTFAVDNGFSICDNVSTTAQEFPTMTAPYNADHTHPWGESVPMKTALALSINNAALYILKQVGIEGFVEFAHRCGITSRMDPFPSVALGVSDISLFEMMGAYSMFPGRGINSQPFFITKIEDKNGMLIKSFSASQKEIISPTTAYKMVQLMRGVVDHGTGARMRYRYGIKNDVAGKTGTTSNQADAWFMGYAPELIAGVWIGCDDREFRFRTEQMGQGAASALPVWAYFMRRVWADKSLNINPNAKFAIPDAYRECDIPGQTDTNPGTKPGKGVDDDIPENAPDVKDFN